MAEIKTIQEAARLALLIQDAVNLAAVIRAWGDMQPAILADCDGQTRKVYEHPLQILMLSKATSLMAVDANGIGAVTKMDQDQFGPAYKWAREVSSG